MTEMPFSASHLTVVCLDINLYIQLNFFLLKTQKAYYIALGYPDIDNGKSHTSLILDPL